MSKKGKGKGWTDSFGYISKTGPDGKRNREHRIVWERHHGPIPDGWVVHHKNEKRKDNRIENLEAMPRGQHQKLHKKPKPPCKICGKPQNARRLCILHYSRWYEKNLRPIGPKRRQ